MNKIELKKEFEKPLNEFLAAVDNLYDDEELDSTTRNNLVYVLETFGQLYNKIILNK